jgi:hypothetical protein
LLGSNLRAKLSVWQRSAHASVLVRVNMNISCR